ASGMLPIADGSDLGGSLRNPANFNNVVALRPSIGRVLKSPPLFPELPDFAVHGPMGRSVDDVAFLLGAMTGESVELPPREFHAVTIAWCPDLGGLPLDGRVRGVLESQRRIFEMLGAHLVDAAPDLSDADEIFLTIRRWRSAAEYGPLLAANRDLF